MNKSTIIASLASLAILAGCTATTPTATGTPAAGVSMSSTPAASTAAATNETIADAGLTYAVPAGFKKDPADGTLMSDDQKVAVNIVVLPEALPTAEAFAGVTEKGLSAMMTDIQVVKAPETYSNGGLTGFVTSGTAKIQGKEATWQNYMISGSKSIILTVVGDGATALEDKKAALDGMLNSFALAPGATPAASLGEETPAPGAETPEAAETPDAGDGEVPEAAETPDGSVEETPGAEATPEAGDSEAQATPEPSSDAAPE